MRNDLYFKEANELLRVISCYKALHTQQLIRLFPGREEKTRTLINKLRQQGRIWISRDSRTVKMTEEEKMDKGIVKAFWILLDFIERVEFHCPGSFPVSLSFFLEAEFYEIIFVPHDQEVLITQSLSRNLKEVGKRIIIVENAEQIRELSIPGSSGFCTVSDDGSIQYYQKTSEDKNE